MTVEHKPIFRHIVAIGTSTGGPHALQQVITTLPKSFLAPILIVQHMPPVFTKSLAERLDSLSEIHVVEAENGCTISPATAYIAPGDWHMRVVKKRMDYQIELSNDSHRSGHRPSVDILFESLVSYPELIRHIVIMTGMGNDGARGMNDLIASGARSTIAESEASCVIYGMPRAAVELNDVQFILPLNEIPHKLIELVYS